ncbi:MAG: hypothetical protein ACR650_08340 [Methylocystis sp.]|jgi:hypothetical protein
MSGIALMFILLVAAYLLMIGLVEFSERIIEKPQLGKRNETMASSEIGRYAPVCRAPEDGGRP